MGTIAREIESEIETNPTTPVKYLQDKIQNKHQIHVSEVKVKRAKKLANDKKDDNFIQQYGMLRAYLEQLVKASPGSHVKIDGEPCHDPNSPTRQFRRVYICYGATMRGFQMLGREFLGLDGCFMKGPFPGQILISVSIDGNRCIYPVAFALVEAETLNSWTWFLECLIDTLELPTDANFTFISDRQKGLIPALEKVFPRAEHQFCVRHILKNMRKQWHGDVFKNMFLKAVGATSIPYYLKAMEEIKEADATLYDWVNQIAAKAWSKAHYSGRAKCDIQLNNMCESFNKQLVGARDKPVITCLEYIREYMTKRIINVRKMVSKVAGPLTPNATKTFEEIKTEASQLTVLMVDAHNYQIGRPKKKRNKSWDERKKRAAEDKRKKRVEEVEKVFSKGGRMTRKGGTVKCRNCGGFGHNRKTWDDNYKCTTWVMVLT
ncbi:uncharacterized protein LOC143579596 [Bidens hawaiensis]|uniref:uncharacterized protein LOC143579596 n=1 Tax=Bidens hawaiensis TaxID=980011 RepID=UPI00404B3103